MKTAFPVAAAALVPVLALLAGCASNEGSTTASTSGGRATAAVSAPAATATSSTSGGSATTSGTPSTTTTRTTAAAVPTALPTTFGDVNQTISDPDLKESITIKRIARELPWPAGYSASAQAYELVAVEMTWTPSKDFALPIRQQDFAINSGTQFPNRPDALVNGTLTAATWVLLPDSVDKGDPATGWLVFKVDPRKAPKLVLDYTRPAVQITSGGTGSFPTKTFSITLAG